MVNSLDCQFRGLGINSRSGFWIFLGALSVSHSTRGQELVLSMKKRASCILVLYTEHVKEDGALFGKS